MIIYLFGIAFLFFILNAFLIKNWTYSIIGGAILFLFMVISKIKDGGFKVIVTETELKIINRKKEKVFNRSTCKFSYYIKDYSECDLKIMDENGKQHTIDCSDLGYTQFMVLLEDLNVTGDDAPVYKVETKRKEI